MIAKKAHSSIVGNHAEGKRRGKLVIWLGVPAVLMLLIGVCFWLWHIEWLRPWLAGIGAALVAILGPIPGLLSPETRLKWLALVVVAALIGGGTWYISKYMEDQEQEAQYREHFSESLLNQIPPIMKNELCRGVARQLQHLVKTRDYQGAKQQSTILRALSPSNGHALYFAGEADRGLRDYGDMLSALKNYLYYADKNQAEAYEGSADDCYDRASGYCAERTAWIEHLLANYFYVRAQSQKGSEKAVTLEEVVAHELYVARRREVGFHADSTTRDTTDLLRQAAEQMKALGLGSNQALSIAAQVEDARNRPSSTVPQK
jgi:hypothetical protein